MPYRINYDRLQAFESSELIESGFGVKITDWVESDSDGKLRNVAVVSKGGGDSFIGVAVYNSKAKEVRSYATMPGEYVRVRVETDISNDYTPLKVSDATGLFSPAGSGDVVVAVSLPGSTTSASATTPKIINAVLIRKRSWNSVGAPTAAANATPVSSSNSGEVSATAVPIATGGIDAISYAPYGDEWTDNSFSFDSDTNMLVMATGRTAGGPYTLKNSSNR